MRKKELMELDEKEHEKSFKLASITAEELRKEKQNMPIAKYLYPEFPWKRRERAYINPYFLPYHWAVFPFYSCPILAITPSTAEKFKERMGLNAQEFSELWRKNRIYPILVWPFKAFTGKNFDHLHPIIERNPPSERTMQFFLASTGMEDINRYVDEASKSNRLISDWKPVYALLCILGFRERITDGCDFILSTKDQKLIDVYRRNWLGELKHQILIPPLMGALSPMDFRIRDFINYPLKGSYLPTQVFAHEVSEFLVRDLAFVSPADPVELNIDLLIETQDHAKDLREAYNEFCKLVNDFKVEEALETRDTLVQVAEEYKRSTPLLDKVSGIVHGGISISAAAVTYTALSSFVSPWIAGLAAGSQIYAYLKSEEMKKWIEGKYAKLLSKIGWGQFSFVHVWKAHRIVKKKK